MIAHSGITKHRQRGMARALGPLACSVLVALGALGQGTGASAQEAGPLIRGLVLEGTDGPPIKTADVYLVDGRGTCIRGAITDEDGRFRLTAPRPGLYRLRVERIGTSRAERGRCH